MKTITLITVLALIAQDLWGTQSSVGGSLTILLILVIAIVAVGIHDAWAHRRGVLGWLASLGAAIVGGTAGMVGSGMAFEAIIPYLHLNGSLASSQHPMLYIASAGSAMITVFGCWVALQLVDLLRRIGGAAKASS